MAADVLQYYIRAQDQTQQALATATRGLKDYEQQVNGLDQRLRSLQGLAGGALSIAGASTFVKGIVDTITEFDRLKNTLAQGVGIKQVGQEMQFLTETAKTLGLDLSAAGDAYGKLTAATRGTELQGQATRDIFVAVSKASVAMGLSADQTQGALLALQQMISKGKVQAEELRGQLGERLPGAFQIFARSIGKTTGELDEMLQKGEVGIDTLRGFARQLEVETADAFKQAADGMQASVNRMGAAWTELKRTFSQGDVGDRVRANIDFLTLSMRGLEEALKSLDKSSGFFDSLQNMAGAFQRPWQQYFNPKSQKSGPIAGTNNDDWIGGMSSNIEAQVAVRRKALEQVAELQKKYLKDVKNEELIKQITDVTTKAGTAESEVKKLIAAATKPAGKSAIEKINDEIDRLRDSLNKEKLGETAATLLRMKADGAKPSQLSDARAILEEKDALKARVAAAEESNRAFDEQMRLQEQIYKQGEDFVRKIRIEAEEQQFLATMLGKTNAERQIELQLRRAAAEGVSADQMPQLRARLTAGSNAARLTELVDAGQGSQIEKAREDMRLLTDAYQQFLDTGGEQGITKVQYLDAIAERLDLVAPKAKKADELMNQFVQTFTSGAEDALFSGEKFSDVLEKLLIDMAKLILRAQLLGPMFQSIFKAAGGGGGGTLWDLITGVGSAVTGGAGGAAAGGSEFIDQAPFLDSTAIATKSAPQISIKSNVSVGSGVDRAQVEAALRAQEVRIKSDLYAADVRGV